MMTKANKLSRDLQYNTIFPEEINCYSLFILQVCILEISTISYLAIGEEIVHHYTLYLNCLKCTCLMKNNLTNLFPCRLRCLPHLIILPGLPIPGCGKPPLLPLLCSKDTLFHLKHKITTDSICLWAPGMRVEMLQKKLVFGVRPTK